MKRPADWGPVVIAVDCRGCLPGIATVALIGYPVGPQLPSTVFGEPRYPDKYGGGLTPGMTIAVVHGARVQDPAASTWVIRCKKGHHNSVSRARAGGWLEEQTALDPDSVEPRHYFA